jgi:hypothetical protein
MELSSRTVEHSCRAAWLERQGCWSSNVAVLLLRRLSLPSLRRLSLRQRLLIVALLSSVTFDRDDRCCVTAEDCGAPFAIVVSKAQKEHGVRVCLYPLEMGASAKRKGALL